MHDEDTPITGVPILNTQTATSEDDKLDVEPDHNFVDPNKANNNSSKASVHSTGSDISIHSTISDPPHPLLIEEPNDVELREPETQVPILC